MSFTVTLFTFPPYRLVFAHTELLRNKLRPNLLPRNCVSADAGAAFSPERWRLEGHFKRMGDIDLSAQDNTRKPTAES